MNGKYEGPCYFNQSTSSCEIISILLSAIVHKINHNVINIVKVESYLTTTP